MADATAGPTGNAIQVVPPNAEFRGPFVADTKSNLTMTNTSATKVCIKLKVFDNNMVQCKPIAAFMTAGQQMPLLILHKPFQHSTTENYEKRKVGIFYVDAPESANDAVAFAKEVPAANWKVIKIQCKYVGDAAAKESSSAAAKAAAAAAPAAPEAAAALPADAAPPAAAAPSADAAPPPPS